MENMGLTGHQAIYGLHWNTENYHVHIAVNRMNPETMKVVRPHEGHDIEEGHKILALIERKQGWTSEQNARYAVNESGETIRKMPQETAPKPKGKALDFESRTGEKSAQRIAQERGHAIMKNAKSWPELHEKLAAAGLRFERKGSGAIMFVGETAVKASSIDRAFSLKNLCKKLGDFEEGDYSTLVDEIVPEPVSSINLDEWKTYQAEWEIARKTPPAVPENLDILAAKTRHRQERKVLLRDLAGRGLKALNGARHRLALRQKTDLRRLRLEKKTPRRKGMPRFETWLRVRGLTRQADLWRYRNRAMLKPFTPPPTKTADPFAAYAAHRETLHWKIAGPSRLDALIALAMRVGGHNREDVAGAILRHAQETRDENRDWNRYAERAVAFAFGAAGDAELAQNEALREQLRKTETPEEMPKDEPRPEPPRIRMR
jgi:hypothetical protein